MSLSEQVMELTKDVGEMKAVIATIDQKIDNIPTVIELAMVKHEQSCGNKSRFVREELLESKFNEYNEKRFSKKVKTFMFIKEVIAFGIAIFIGKQL